MKVQVALLLLGFVAVAMAMPADIIDFDENNVDHEQEGVAGKAVEGKYKYVGPDGEEYFVKYVADHLGFRVVDSNALPKVVEPVETDSVNPVEEDSVDAVEEEEDEE